MLELKNIVVRIDSGKEILSDLSLKIDDEKFVVVTGPNGGGKSTLAKVIAGVMTPDAGRILFNGEDITALDITERARRGITFAFQQPVRFKGITVRDLIGIAAGDLDIDEKRLCAFLYDVGLCARDYIDREVDASLSGGEIKRIEIATAIARRSAFSVFDEPEAGIDIWSFNNLTGVFEKMRRESKGSIMIISHQERIFDIADEIVVLADGKVRMQGSKEKILPQLLGEDVRRGFCAGGMQR